MLGIILSSNSIAKLKESLKHGGSQHSVLISSGNRITIVKMTIYIYIDVSDIYLYDSKLY